VTDQQPTFTGLLGPWGVPCTPEQQQAELDYLAKSRAHAAIENARKCRYEAVELAIRALRPVAGAYDLPGLGPSGVRADYADSITGLADRFVAYIQDGA
jgi:hypothetical protein